VRFQALGSLVTVDVIKPEVLKALKEAAPAHDVNSPTDLPLISSTLNTKVDGGKTQEGGGGVDVTLQTYLTESKNMSFCTYELRFYLIERVHEFVLQTSIPSKIRELFLVRCSCKE